MLLDFWNGYFDIILIWKKKLYTKVNLIVIFLKKEMVGKKMLFEFQISIFSYFGVKKNQYKNSWW